MRAGFFVRSFENSAHTDMGFRVDHTLMASITTRRLCDRANSRLVPDRLATGGLFTLDMMADPGTSVLT